MIRKLRMNFITLSMMTLFVLLSVIIISMNILNYNAVVAKADDTLSILANNHGVFPDFEGGNRPPGMSPEAPFESRYFSVLLDHNENVIQTDTGKIKSVDAQQAIAFARQITSKEKKNGFVESYRFICRFDEKQTRITFLDCRREINAFHSFLVSSIGMALTGYVLFFFVLLFFSGRFIRPVAESYEKQKRFITDASHEIKTPLTIINADADVLEMEIGENEWLTDIQKQARRLTELTNDLVYLSRMEESENSLPLIEFPFSDVVSEVTSSYQALAQTHGKTFLCDIQPMLSLTGNEKAIHQLIGILLDNALKYSPDNGTISINLERKNKSLQLSVYNTTSYPVLKENLHLLFERFYRPDSSRNSQTGGYGIGLSVAKAIVAAHNGKIHATTKDGLSLHIIVSFPL